MSYLRKYTDNAKLLHEDSFWTITYPDGYSSCLEAIRFIEFQRAQRIGFTIFQDGTKVPEVSYGR